MNVAFYDTPVPLTTPWGHVDLRCQAIAPGIWSVSTDSDGGILISEERRDAMPEWARSFRPVSELSTAFERILDAAVPCAVWAEEFDLDSHLAAISAIQRNVLYFTERGLDVDAALGRLATSLYKRDPQRSERREDGPEIEDTGR